MTEEKHSDPSSTTLVSFCLCNYILYGDFVYIWHFNRCTLLDSREHLFLLWNMLGYSDSVKLNSGYFKDCISAEFSVVLCYLFRLYFRDCYGLISPLSALVYKQ